MQFPLVFTDYEMFFRLLSMPTFAFFHLGYIYLPGESYCECKFSESWLIPARGLVTFYLPQCVQIIH